MYLYQARVLDEKRETGAAAAKKKHGKTCAGAMLCSSYEQAQQWKAAGALLLAYSSDSEVMHGAGTARRWGGSRGRSRGGNRHERDGGRNDTKYLIDDFRTADPCLMPVAVILR